MDDETPTPDSGAEEITGASFPTNEDGAEHEALESEQIEWLRKQLQEVTERLMALESQVTEAAANLPTPESVALLVEQATQPTREALENLARELRDSALPTPPALEPENPAQNSQEDSIRTEAPQESAEESQAPAPLENQPQVKIHRITKV